MKTLQQANTMKPFGLLKMKKNDDAQDDLFVMRSVTGYTLNPTLSFGPRSYETVELEILGR